MVVDDFAVVVVVVDMLAVDHVVGPGVVILDGATVFVVGETVVAGDSVVVGVVVGVVVVLLLLIGWFS